MLSLTASTEVTKFRSQIITAFASLGGLVEDTCGVDEVLSSCNRRGDICGCSPEPTTATNEVQNSISAMLTPPSTIRLARPQRAR